MTQIAPITFATRFRGFLPVVIDVETGGFNSQTDALLEIAAVFIEMRSDGTLTRGETTRYHVVPFPGANMEAASLAVNGIDPHHPLRPAIPEQDALQRIFREVRNAIRAADCTRAVLVGHNAFFDLNFLNAAVARAQVKRNPFHPFSSFDTASAHSAAYDAERTADLFCTVCNQFQGVFDASRRRLAAMGPLEIEPSTPGEPLTPDEPMNRDP
jgi:ribonuclease T